MRIVFFGTPEIAVPALKAVAQRYDVTAVVCPPDRPHGRSARPVPPPVKVWAIEHGLPVHQPDKLNDGAFEQWLRAQAPDVCTLAAYGRFLKEPILNVPRHGFLNVHPSLLPRHRGPSPIQSAILEGQHTTGVTIIRLTLEMDAGDMLLQQSMPIAPDDTTVTLSTKLGELGAALLVQGLAAIESGTAVFTPQDSSRATYTKLLEKHDGCIRWAEPGRRIHNLVRAMLPWPVAYCRFRGETWRIHETCIRSKPTAAPPGTVVRIDKDHVMIAAGEGCVGLRTLQPAGKRIMSVSDYLRGHTLRVGDVLEDG